jgi:hypothetical protein
MAETCREVQEWVEESVEKPIEEWENRQEERCREEECNWWTLCLNKLFCWIVVIAVKVVRWVVVTVGKWVGRVVCEVVATVLDAAAFLVNLVLSIPILGGIIRTVLNWVTEIIWRIVGLLDFALSLLGVRWRKRMYVALLIPRSGGKAITTEAAMLPKIEKARELYKRLCNVDLIYRGACVAPADAPSGSLVVGCDAGGFFSDWWLGGSYFEFSSATCEFDEGFRRLLGYGAGIIVIPVENVTPDSGSSLTVGCSFASTQNYVVVEPTAGPAVAAHEIGHACWLSHTEGEPENLMFPRNIAPEPTLTSWQVSVVRWSKHCVYF